MNKEALKYLRDKIRNAKDGKISIKNLPIVLYPAIAKIMDEYLKDKKVK